MIVKAYYIFKQQVVNTKLYKSIDIAEDPVALRTYYECFITEGRAVLSLRDHKLFTLFVGHDCTSLIYLFTVLHNQRFLYSPN